MINVVLVDGEAGASGFAGLLATRYRRARKCSLSALIERALPGVGTRIMGSIRLKLAWLPGAGHVGSRQD